MKISVVIASGAGGDFLYRCLDSLQEQTLATNAEVIVVDRCGAYTRCRLRTEYPFAIVIPAEMEPRPSIPELRMIGVKKPTVMWSPSSKSIASLHQIGSRQFAHHFKKAMQPSAADSR